MRLLALTRYGSLGASSRLRTFQYKSYLEDAGIEVCVHSLLENEYLDALYSRRSAWRSVARGYFLRLRTLLGIAHFDAVLIEKEALPWLPAVVELGLLRRGTRVVVDYDDAVFHRYDKHHSLLIRVILGQKLDRLMRRADLVIAGNKYLEDRARLAKSPWVEQIPTVVDLDRYPLTNRSSRIREEVVIGWIGSPSTADYLQLVSEALKEIGKTFKIRCVAVGARADQLNGTPFEAIDWAEDTEVASLQNFDIGIMPLVDGPWERGKCGYKLVQYMACGLPVIASPVGANVDIVRVGENGLLAADFAEWTESLAKLIANAELRVQMGSRGRRQVEEKYCLQIQGPRLAGLLKKLAGTRIAG